MLNEHDAVEDNKTPVKLAQVGFEVSIEIVDGKIILIFPEEVRASLIVIEKIYEVFELTVVATIVTEPESVLEEAIKFVVP